MDRMIIVGADGTDRMIVEGTSVTDTAVHCPYFEANGHHELRFLDLTDFEQSICQHCQQTVKAIHTKGEKVVY